VDTFSLPLAENERLALLDPTRNLAISHAELRQRIDSLADSLLARGVAPGHRVIISSWTGVEATLGFLAILRAGATALPVSPQLTDSELTRHLPLLSPDHALLHDAASPRTVCTDLGIPVTEFDAADPWAALENAELPELHPGALALILQTSGTTGGPKSVPLTQANMAASTAMIGATYDLGPDDIAYCIMPLFHVHGLIGVALSTLATGGTVLIPSRFRMGAFWETVADHGVTWCSGVPTLLAAIPSGPRDPGTLRFLRSASSPLPPTLATRLEDDLGIPVLEAYGMTEGTHQIASNPLPPADRLSGSVGLPTGTELAVVDDTWTALPPGSIGEVVVRGASITAGYLDNDEANAAAFRDGWFRTGDLGRLSTTGYLFLVGRVKEMINRGGEKISPREVDETLLTHPCVIEAAAYGVSDAKYGEVVHAVVVTSGDVNAASLITYCGAHLAGFKIPRTIHVVDAIPKGPTGKIQRNLLAQAMDAT
jgi:acyl-CoA synthetase (AMP-forming)/AMP-acid ligase II